MIKTIKLKRASNISTKLANLTDKELDYGEPMYNVADKAVVIGDGAGTDCDKLDRIDLIPLDRTRAEVFWKTDSGTTKLTDISGNVLSVGGGGSGTVTSITAGEGLAGGTITTAGTIDLADGYGDLKNPYGAKTANYVLAGPSDSSRYSTGAVPEFRALVSDDIPDLSSKYATNSSLSSYATTTALNTEIANRQSNDTSLSTAISDEATTRANADATLTTAVAAKQDTISSGNSVVLTSNTLGLYTGISGQNNATITISSSNPSGGNNGDIWFKY